MERPTSHIPRVAAWLADSDAEVPTAAELVAHACYKHAGAFDLSPQEGFSCALDELADLLVGMSMQQQGTSLAAAELRAKVARLERFASSLLDRLVDQETPVVIADWRRELAKIARGGGA